jgi:hypothetical protein
VLSRIAGGGAFAGSPKWAEAAREAVSRSRAGGVVARI